MGKKSKQMNQSIAQEMEGIRVQYGRCQELTSYFKDRLEEFLDAPLLSGKRKTLYGEMYSVSLKLLPEVQKTISRIEPGGTADSLLDVFETFLNRKKVAHQNDWTNLKKTTLQKNLTFVEQTKTELEDARRNCYDVPQYVADTLAHCKQA